MSRPSQTPHSSRARRRGQVGPGVTEYLLIIVLVALLVIGGVVLLGPSIGHLITQLSSNL